MTIVSSTKDAQALTLTMVTELAAPATRVWQVLADPRQLERWWGPPTWPATFEQHEFVVGGQSRYFMTGPAGEKARGWWRFVVIEELRSVEFEDGFSDESGEPDPAMPTIRVRVELEETSGCTRMTLTSGFASLQDMEQLINMGMAEGLTQAMGQLDDVLAAPAAAGGS
jgi:uncharacterized protein YndB with AHSA1/START domain